MAGNKRLLTSLALSLCAVSVSVAVAGCSAASAESTKRSMAEELKATGWVEEPVVDGMESQIRDIRPTACQDLFDLLDRADGAEARSFGFRNSKTGSYLLAIDHPDVPDPGSLSSHLREAAEACPRLTMGYDSTSLAYDVSVADLRSGRTEIRLNGAEQIGGQQGERVVDMIVTGVNTDSGGRLIRVMSSDAGIGATEEKAAEAAAVHP
ncbi:hypothetical protein FE633_06530 [Streptomyces montanus]|uniref:Sensor domain-containing protein n=1 Tax=Streptomyces montanus TaxID=2580423 RepID=A0A5R9FZT2_9ACTN|nr:hypothetical protein [Streptomyces montanus]TLS46778.1 hypothetical protein FE633_06530 [Streptomyces montanus]